MRAGAVLGPLVLSLLLPACGPGTGGRLFQQYEYEEEMYLSLDGSATMYVNTSIPAMNALRGTAFDERPNTRVDRDAVRAYFSSPVTRVVRVSTSRRSNRRFVHVRIAVDDIRRLNTAPPFAWSSYSLERAGDLVKYKQMVGAGQARLKAAPTDANPTTFRGGWTGQELVAFRIHIPSVIEYHDNGAELRRGNILVWEQPLSERLIGVPLEFDVRMEPQSILYTTLFLFAGTIAAAALAFAFVIWRLAHRGRTSTLEPRTPSENLRTGNAERTRR